MKIVVQDASTLLNLLKSGLLRSAAKALGLHILTTDLVAEEIQEPRAEFDQAVVAGQVEIRDCTAAELQEIVEEQRGARELSLPDVSVITLARKTGCPLFSSDGPVRAYARKYELVVRGELWILDALVECGHLTPKQAAGKLQNMLALKARLPPEEVEIRMTAWTGKNTD
jgi:predicted nucleic acid-binding protein